jgi:N-acetylmuramoyl-L-alanine amidase
VLDLKQPVRVKSFPMTPDADHGHRLVVDLIAKGAAKGAGSAPARAGAAGHTVVSSRANPARDLVVAIDAGHGGEDPGALGARGTREKDVTLGIARRLAALVEKEPGMRPLMIRDADVFVPLRQRIRKARKHEADIFISIHADAFTNPDAQGSSVFTLSRRGATSEAAKWLADKENSADLIGGVDLGSSDDQLATVLLDMAQNATLEHSAQAAGAVLNNLSRLGVTHKGEVQKAGFVVLKSPDIPSLLVETAFISNPDEEARLLSGANQQHLAEAILAGIKQYFYKYRPQTLARTPAPAAAPAIASAAGRRHVIGAGDTLAQIARRYRVSLASLRTANNLGSDTIHTGQVLTIPGANPGDG